MAARDFAKNPDWLDAARHGLRSLRTEWRDGASGRYDWTRVDDRTEDPTRHAYGVAFVLLAYAVARQSGLREAASWLAESWQLLEARFYEHGPGLYRDEVTPDWQFSDYHGQNANMHLCEALQSPAPCGHRAGRIPYSDQKSPAGKTDYHTMGACHDVLAVLRAQPALFDGGTR